MKLALRRTFLPFAAMVSMALPAVAPQAVAAGSDPTLSVDMELVHTCPAAHCETEVDVFTCSATFTPGLPTNVPYTTAVECYAPGVDGAAPGMGLTVTPGPRSNSGGYASGLWGLNVCLTGEAVYLYQGTTSKRTLRVGPICRPSVEWSPI